MSPGDARDTAQPLDQPLGDALFDLHGFLTRYWSAAVHAFSYSRRLGLDPQDIAQEGLLVVLDRFDRLDFASEEYVFAYWRVVGQNLIRALSGPDAPAHRRREESRAEVPDEARAVDPAQQAVLYADLAAAFRRLSPRDQTILRLAAEGHDHATMAKLMGMPSEEASRKALERARVAAHEALGPSVTALLAAVARLSRNSADAAAPVAGSFTAIATVVVAALVLPFVAPATPPARATPRPPVAAPMRVHPRKGEPTWAARRAATGTARSDQAPTTATPVDAMRVNRGTPDPGVALVPRVAGCAVKVCASTGGQPVQRGDTLYLRHLGPAGPHVTQDYVPVCENAPRNPVVGCHSASGSRPGTAVSTGTLGDSQ